MRVPQGPPDWFKQVGKKLSLKQVFAAMLDPAVRDFVRDANERYLHWDKVRFQPLPDNLDPLLAWGAIAQSRLSQFQELPLTFADKQKLRYWIPPRHHEWLSTIDQKLAGNIGGTSPFGVPGDRERYLFNSLMEEAIASSQLEGASTTRQKAKEMLRTRRKPRNKAEQMIANNYRAILDIRDATNEPLTPAFLCHLQKVLTENTLDRPAAAGRFRKPSEVVVVEDISTGDAIYTPPPASELRARVEEICAFANERSSPFVHPVIKAIALHFAIGFVHPFVDGNGRTARAVFYWCMLKSGYWLFEFLPISRVIVKSPARYARAYLYTETDKGDLTYFSHYHLNVVSKSIQELYDYLGKQQQQLHEAQELLDTVPNLNHRQRDLILKAIREPRTRYTARENEGKYHVTYNTARTDLQGLESAGLFEKRKLRNGKEWAYMPAPDLLKRLKVAEQPDMPRTATKKQPRIRTILKPPSEDQQTLFD